MSKVAVVYWSGTGNTETMANAVAEGAKGAGAEVDVLVANDLIQERLLNMMESHSDARQWEQRISKNQSLSQCSQR